MKFILTLSGKSPVNRFYPCSEHPLFQLMTLQGSEDAHGVHQSHLVPMLTFPSRTGPACLHPWLPRWKGCPQGHTWPGQAPMGRARDPPHLPQDSQLHHTAYETPGGPPPARVGPGWAGLWHLKTEHPFLKGVSQASETVALQALLPGGSEPVLSLGQLVGCLGLRGQAG